MRIKPGGNASTTAPLHYDDHREHLSILRGAVFDAVNPARLLQDSLQVQDGALQVGPRQIPLASEGKLLLIAFGKAAPGMAWAASEMLSGRLNSGIVAVPHDQRGLAPSSFDVYESGHPHPDQGSLRAGEAVAALLETTTRKDLVLCLISGGGSAMLALPRPGVSLEDLRRLNDMLLRSGAPIEAVNEVRRAVSRLKGGGLARLAAPARVVSLILSDVVGDRLSSIASGPTVLIPARPERAIAVLKQHDLWAI
jgi:hydroxypyruvate reductase